MNDDVVNLEPLDPTRDVSFESRLRSIVAEGMAARRAPARVSPDVFGELATWLRPALAAAALMAGVALPTIAVQRSPISRPATRTGGGTPAEVLGMPASLISLARSSDSPTVSQLAAAVGASDDGAHDDR